MILTEQIRAKYKPTIGLEIHVQLKTRTKLFAPVDNDARDVKPNQVASVICFGMPGVLPVLNRQAVVLAVRAGKALNSQVNSRSSFDRKHYFYPDLPKGYQITQFAQPIVGSGSLEIPVGDKTVTVGITRAHLEEDAGKSTHPKGTDYSLVDLNRAGTPLLEIVSEPDMHSSEEARAYAHEVYLLMKYAGVSEANLFHGNMRFDVNVSVALADSEQLGLRAEIKNINSFRNVERAAEYEIKRQIELLESGQSVVQETRGWDDDRGKTVSQRGKENAHDYRYFPDPDIPPLDLDEEFMSKALENLPKLPAEFRKEFRVIGLDSDVIESLLESPNQARLVSGIITDNGAEHAKRIALWLTNSLRAETISEDALQKVDGPRLLALSQMVSDNLLSSTAAKEVLLQLVTSDQQPQTIAQQLGVMQESDEKALETVVKKILSEQSQAVEDVKAGQEKAVGFIVGQVMKETQGRANPGIVKEIIKRLLAE